MRLFCFHLLLTLIAIFSNRLFAQCTDWSASFGNSNSASIAVDANHNIYAAGGYDSTATFSSTTITTLPHGAAVYLTKYDDSGNFLWAKNICFGDYSPFYLKCLAISGNALYITGGMGSGLTINNLSYPDASIYLIKTDLDGVIQWAKSYNSNTNYQNTQGLSLASDGQSGVYLVGRFKDSLSFDNYHLYGAGGYKAYVAHIDESGNTQWAVQAAKTTITKNNRAGSVIKSANGNVIVGGFYVDSLKFGGNLITDGGVGFLKAYVAAFDENGNNLWINAVKSSPLDQESASFSHVYGIATDSDNNIYASMSNDDTLQLGNITLNKRIVLAKFDANGNLQWVIQQGHPVSDLTSINEFSTQVEVDGDGNIYHSGQVTDGAYYDQQMISTGGSSSLFVAKYSPAGSLLKLISSSGDGSPFHYSGFMDDQDNLYIGGNLTGTDETIGTTTFSNADTSHSVSFALKLCTDDFTGIESQHADDEVSVFPNPVHDVLHITNCKNATIIITDVLRRNIFEKKNLGNAEQLDVSKFDEGIYMINITTGSKTFAGKILKLN